MVQLVTIDMPNHGPQTGLLSQGNVYPSGRYDHTLDVLRDWSNASARLSEMPAKLAERLALTEPRLLAPLPNPGNIYFAGANYKDHVAEMLLRLGLPLESDPKARGHKPWFSVKATGSSVVGPGAAIALPRGVKMLDWELELAVVIGRAAKHVKAEDALGVVAGYTIANDLSARDKISRDGVDNGSPFKWDWVGQKSFDGSCPMGPAITPAEFIGDPMSLDMKLWVNGELMQSSNTDQMIFTIQEQIAHLSSCITLQPGDVILTGTPAGVGMARNRFLKAGDTVRQWIENIGEFTFTIVD